MATITITVTVAGGKFVLDGISQATYSATPGNTYKFDQSDGTNGTHPLRLSTTSDGTHNSGSAYTDGVTTNGTPGSAGAYTQIVVDATTVQSLFYYCSNHSGMGGAFNVGGTGTVQYQDRKGFDIQNSSSDFTSVGQIYYNSSSGDFKAIKNGGAPIGSWSSGGTKNTIVNDGTGSGSHTAGLAFGGVAPPGITADTETYNGTSWTEVNNLNAGRRSLTGTGSQTASLAIAGGEAGSFTAAVEKWDGTNWTEVNDLNTARGYNPGSSGTTTAALAFGGRVDPNPAVTAKTEYYNGTSWTEVNDLNTARYNGAGAGVFPSSLYAGGHSNSPPGATLTVNELWDGTSWTEASDLNTGRNGLGGTGDLNTDVLVFGGAPPETSKTESWNGTAWTEVADLAAPSEDFCSSAVGGGTSALRAAGNVSGARSGATEEWEAASFEIKTLTTS